MSPSVGWLGLDDLLAAGRVDHHLARLARHGAGLHQSLLNSAPRVDDSLQDLTHLLPALLLTSLLLLLLDLDLHLGLMLLWLQLDLLWLDLRLDLGLDLWLWLCLRLLLLLLLRLLGEDSSSVLHTR